MWIQPPVQARIIAVKGSISEQRNYIFQYLQQTQALGIYIDCLGLISRTNPAPYLPGVLHIHEFEERKILALLRELHASLDFTVIIFDPLHSIKTTDLGHFISLLRILFPLVSCFFLREAQFALL